ncbi:MAG: 4Fe-4S dicluster domain-containing protein [bacterium]
MKKTLARIYLGYHFLLHFLKKPFNRRLRGLKPFVDHYGKDGILPLETSDLTLLRRFSDCIHCGYCDTACPSLLQFPRERFPGPRYIAGAFTRNFHHLMEAALDAPFCDGCDACERACPCSIPITQGIGWIREKTV